MNWEELVLGAISIIGIIEWLKNLDPEKKLKKFYKFFPLVLSLVPAVLISSLAENMTWAFIGLNALVIFSFSTLGYQTIIETIEKKIKSV